MQVLSNIPIALLNNIGFMAILFVMYECIKWIGIYKPAQLFVFSLIIQITSLIQFLLTILFPNVFILLNISTIVNAFVLPLNYNNMHEYFLIISIIYCSTLIYFVAKMAYQITQLNRLNRSANFTQSNTYKNLLPKNVLKTCAKVKIGVSKEIDSPITFGWLTPIILLPVAICNQLSTDEIETILLHEIAHIIRNDYLANLIISLNQIILFFNPFSFFLIKELRLQREMACDQIVIKNKPQKIVYMNALLKIAEHVHHQNNYNFALGIFGSKSDLLQRVEYFNNIKSTSYKNFLYKIFVGLIFIIMVFATLLPSKNIQIKDATAVNTINKIKHTTWAITIPKHLGNFKVSKIKVTKKIVNHKQFNDINKATYASLVDQTMKWIKKHESTAKFANYQDEIDNNTYNKADQLLIRIIFSNYQLKRDLLNQKLAKSNNLKEALDYLLESDEFEQMKQYEKWTKEFLQTHPKIKDTSLQEEPIIY